MLSQNYERLLVLLFYLTKAHRRIDDACNTYGYR